MNYNIVIPSDKKTLDDLQIESSVLVPFDNIIISYVDDISKAILKDRFFKEYPELIALAFWMRKSHIQNLKKYFFKQKGDKFLLGRGIVFHLAPSNVDTIFVYSWFLSMLVGNSNILRISDKENIQTDLLLNTISNVLDEEKYLILKNRIAIIKYGHEDDITARLSSLADVRVIWGGDNTVEHIRSIPIRATAIELTFADKFSFSILNSKEVLTCNLDNLITKFYNDSFWFGQMACSSIRLLTWIGNKEENKKAKEIFWTKLNKYVLSMKPNDITPSDIINKYVAECSMAIEGNIHIETIDNPYINKINITHIDEVREDLHCGTGLFYELDSDNVEDLFELMTKKNQTIAYFGFDKKEIETILYKSMPQGIDRVVPIGQSLDFSYIWDGYDLFSSFCREIEIN